MVERDLPQETSQMRALHFSKGCYLGQEIVERIRSRGNVHRHLRPLELDGPVPAGGTELTLEDGTVRGQITSAAELPLTSGSAGVCAGHDARGGGGAAARASVQGRGGRGNGARILDAPPRLRTLNYGSRISKLSARNATDEKLEAMSDTPKFEVIDRRKMKAEEEKESGQAAAPTAPRSRRAPRR